MGLVFLVLFGLMLVGVPVAFAIMTSGVTYLAITDTNIAVLAQRMVYGLNSFTLLAVPLFILVGNLMDFGGISKRLTDWAKSLLGWLPGGLGVVTVFSCAIFAALTGSGPATVAAIGSIMLPAMTKAGYSKATGAGLVASAGALGPIIPPSIPMIVYGVTMNLSIPEMFVAGVIPGLVIAGALAIVNVIFAYRNPEVLKFAGTIKFDAGYCLKMFWKALGALGLPVLILGGIYGGIFTPTESAAVGIVYAVILGFALGELKVKDFPQNLDFFVKDFYDGKLHYCSSFPFLLGCF
jgi:C4-dicarboxylate transporter, DctM subunit